MSRCEISPSSSWHLLRELSISVLSCVSSSSVSSSFPCIEIMTLSFFSISLCNVLSLSFIKLLFLSMRLTNISFILRVIACSSARSPAAEGIMSFAAFSSYTLTTSSIKSFPCIPDSSIKAFSFSFKSSLTLTLKTVTIVSTPLIFWLVYPSHAYILGFTHLSWYTICLS